MGKALARLLGKGPGQIALTRAFTSGRYWDRTSDLFRVEEARYRCANRPCLVEVETGFEPVCTALQAAASPLGHSTVRLLTEASAYGSSRLRADDGTRTRDPHLGKVMRYQLRYVRTTRPGPGPFSARPEQ